VKNSCDRPYHPIHHAYSMVFASAFRLRLQQIESIDESMRVAAAGQLELFE
jgi:hypothetical protein